MIGILKYLTVILVSVFLPILLLILCLNFKIYNYYPSLRQYDDILLTVIGYIFILFILIYFIIPILATILAIKHHWSKYLDNFFNQLKLPTIILGIVIAVIIIYEKYHIMIDFSYSRFWVLFYYAIIPPYCLIYSVILIHNIYQKIKNKT
jgi:hypothetical protein